MQESELIPFTPSPLPEGPWLVFAPHADDETFGMGGSLILASQQNIPVTLVILTNGSQGGSHDKLIKIRKQEAAKMADQINAHKLLFWDQPDRHLTTTPQQIEKIAELLDEDKPKSVFMPALTEFHPDHRAASYLVWHALKQYQFQGEQFAYEISTQQTGCNYLVDISSVIEQKKQLMVIYQSQISENNYIDTVLALNKSRTYTLPTDIKYAEAYYHFHKNNNSVTENIIEQFRSIWNQDTLQAFPLISIIVRTKDRLSSLKKALLSIAQQSYNNIEVVIINDGGCDVTDVIDTFANAFFSIRSHDFEENQGRTLAANQGLEMSTGEFITFLDDDDIIYPNHIESLVAAINETHYKVVYNNIETTQGIEFKSEFDKQLLQTGNFLPIHSVLFSREFIDQGIRFDDSLDLYEDWDFWLQLAERTPFFHLDVVGGFYNNMGDSTIGFGRNHSEVIRNQLKIYDKLFKRIGSAGISDIFQTLKEKISILHTDLSKLQTALESVKDDKHQALLQIEQLLNERTAITASLSAANAIEHKQQLQIEQLLNERNNIINSLNQLTETVSQHNNQIAAMDSSLKIEIQEKEMMKQSLSWKLTKPLRYFKRLFQSKGPA